MKKIDDQAAAKVFEDIIREEDRAFELNGQQYIIVALDNEDDFETTVEEDVEKYPELKQKLFQAKKDIKEGNYFTSEEMRDMIRSGQI